MWTNEQVYQRSVGLWSRRLNTPCMAATRSTYARAGVSPQRWPKNKKSKKRKET